MEDLIKKIKEKPELKGIPDSIIKELIEKYTKKYQINITEMKKSDIKIIIKEVRAKLRLYTGRFQISNKHLSSDREDELSILKSHSSTNERISFYPRLKEEIKKLHPKSILDLGCGLNPLELASQYVYYYASDINQTHLDIIKDFFKKNKIQGETFIYDLRNLSKYPEPLPETDLALLFKVLDIIDDKGRANAEKIVSIIPAKHILVSFSTIKISGKPMNRPNRVWFEKMLHRLNKSFSTFKSENEIFYLIDNKQL
jgi:SAM-dependent methyltransferase